MLEKSFQRGPDYVFIISLFFLAQASAFLFKLWLYPAYPLFEFLIWLVVVVIIGWILRKKNLISDFVFRLRRNWIVLPFSVFAGLSIFWSVEWEISLFRWLVLLFTIIAGGYIGLKYDMKTIIQFLSVFSICILFLAVLFVLFVPVVGVVHYYTIQGAWGGMYWQKNHMGFMATFINMLFLVNIIYSSQSNGKRKYILLWISLYLFSLFFLYQTDSVGAYITTLFLHGEIVLTLIWLKFGKNFRRSHYLVFAVLLILSSILLFSNLEQVFGLFNRSTNLTGRVPMWAYLFDTFVSKRPFEGYGLNAFWRISSHQVALQRAAGYADPIIIADNGFIDIIVNTGYIGLSLFLVFYLGVWWHSVKYATKAKDIIGIFPVLLMSYTLVANISWSLLFENDSLFIVLMIAVLYSVTSKTPIDHRADKV